MAPAAASFLDRTLVDHLRSRRVVVWAAALGLLAAILAFVPLFDVLGFEFSFVLALAGSFAAADLGAAYVRRVRGPEVHPVERIAPPGRLVARLTALAALGALGLLVPPLAIISLNALRVRQCDWIHGGVFYALLPGLSALAGTAAGVTSGLVLGRRPRLAIVAAWLVVAASLALGAWRFVAAPPIFGYDPFVGYFPGSLYDDLVTLGAPFFWSRLYQAAVATAALAACAAALDPASLTLAAGRLRERAVLRERRAPIALAAAAAVLAAGLGASSARLGFAIDADDLARALGGRRTTEHFVIVYPRGAPFEHEMDAIAREHELRYAQLARTLGVEPRGRITSFYFASAAEKQRWMGAGRVDIAKPWRREIYVEHDDFPHGSLRHELAHVFAGEFGDPIFRVSARWLGWPPARFNVGFIEGLAVAADASGDGRLLPHEAARAMLDQGRLPPVEALLSPGFFAFSSARSYTAAGSFVRFLLERHGAEKLRAAYRAGGTPAALRDLYGQPLAALERAWHEELRALAVSPTDRAVARERFRRPGLFGRPCARAVARRAARAGELLGRGETDRAIALLRRVCADDPGEPSHRIGLAAALERGGRGDEALAIYRELAGAQVSPPLEARVLTAQADLLARRGDLAAARDVVAQALELPVDDPTRRGLLVRQLALADDSSGARALRAYVLARGPGGGEPDPLVLLFHAGEIAAALPASGLGPYLQARLLAARGAHAEAARALARALALGLPDPLFAREADRILARASFLVGDLAATRAAAARMLAAGQPAALQAEGRDWLERCQFAETGRLQ